MDLSSDFYLNDALLWSLVKKFTKQDSINSPQDYMNEARAAAAFAVAKYDAKKNDSLKAWICECVKNRMIDMERKAGREVRTEPLELHGAYSSAESDIHFSITMRQLLDDSEYQVFHARFVEDRSEREIGEIFSLTRRGVRTCLSRILQKYTLIEENHHKISTQRVLTNKWLETSPD